MWHHIREKIALWIAVRGEGGVAGEEKFGVPKFFFRGMPLISTQIGSQTLLLACVLTYLYYLDNAAPLVRILRCNDLQQINTHLCTQLEWREKWYKERHKAIEVWPMAL